MKINLVSNSAMLPSDVIDFARYMLAQRFGRETVSLLDAM